MFGGVAGGWGGESRRRAGGGGGALGGEQRGGVGGGAVWAGAAQRSGVVGRHVWAGGQLVQVGVAGRERSGTGGVSPTEGLGGGRGGQGERPVGGRRGGRQEQDAALGQERDRRG